MRRGLVPFGRGSRLLDNPLASRAIAFRVRVLGAVIPRDLRLLLLSVVYKLGAQFPALQTRGRARRSMLVQRSLRIVGSGHQHAQALRHALWSDPLKQLPHRVGFVQIGLAPFRRSYLVAVDVE